MPTGVIINSLSVLFGGLFGSLLGDKLSTKFKTELTLIFGVASMGMGINAIIQMKNMPAVIFAVVLGTGIGLLIHFGRWIDRGAVLMERPISKFFRVKTIRYQIPNLFQHSWQWLSSFVPVGPVFMGY